MLDLDTATLKRVAERLENFIFKVGDMERIMCSIIMYSRSVVGIFIPGDRRCWGREVGLSLFSVAWVALISIGKYGV